jgi:hypothetical protein
MQVTYIKIKNISDENTIINFVHNCLKFMTDDEFDKIAFHEINETEEIAFAFLTEQQTENFVKELKSVEMYISHQNITDAVLVGNANKNTTFEKVFSSLNIDTFVIDLLNDFLKNYLTKDIVLDKILENGIDSLTKLDKDILDA